MYIYDVGSWSTTTDVTWCNLEKIDQYQFCKKSTELSTCSPPLPEHIDEWPRIHAADYVAQVTELGSASSQRASSSAAHAL